MTALSDVRQTPRSDKRFFPAPVKAGATIYQGAMLVWDGGYVKPAAKAADQVLAGRAEESVAVPAGGSDGDATCLVARPGLEAFRWAIAATVVQAKVGGKAYIEDDQTVTDVAAGSTAIGTLIQIEDGEAWVI